MEAKVSFVFTSCSLLIDSGEGKNGGGEVSAADVGGTRSSIDLPRLAELGWNVELQRNAAAEPTRCLFRLPLFVYRNVVYSGVVATLSPSGRLRVACKGNVDAALAVTKEFRNHLESMLKCPDSSAPSVVARHNGVVPWWLLPPYKGGHSRIEVSDAKASVRGRDIELVWFNVTLRPLISEIQRLRIVYGLETDVCDNVSQPSAPRRGGRKRFRQLGSSPTGKSVRMNVIGDALLQWIRDLFSKSTTAERETKQDGSADAGDGVLKSELSSFSGTMLGIDRYLASKQLDIQPHLVSWEVRRLPRRAALQFSLRWKVNPSVVKPLQPIHHLHKEEAVEPSTQYHRAEVVASSREPLIEDNYGLTSEVFFDASSALSFDYDVRKDEASGTVASSGIRDEMRTADTTLASSGDVKVDCVINATGRVVAGSSSTEAVEQVAKLIVLPMMLVMADVQ